MSWRGTKRVVFDEALRLFSEKGYNVVTMREIAAAAGVGTAAIYSHFESKEDILNEIFNAFERGINGCFVTKETVDRYIETDTPQCFLERLLQQFMQNLTGTKTGFFWKAYRIACMEQMTNARARELIVCQLHAGTAKSIQYALDSLMERGKIPDFDTVTFSILWMRSIYAETTVSLSYFQKEEIAQMSGQKFHEFGKYFIEVAISGQLPYKRE